MQARGPIPSISALRAFEAVAREESFVRAAASLNVSVGAVSHQINALEASLNAALFERGSERGRGRRQTRLTRTGEDFLGSVAPALDQLAGACANIRSRRRRRRRAINVSANAPTCSMWLAPRLARYAAGNRKVEILVKVVDGEPDVSGSGIDLAVVRLRRVNAHRVHLADKDRFLMGETVFPVCAPEILSAIPGLRAEPARLIDAQLLQEENADSPELDWSTWLPLLGVDPRARPAVVRCSGFSPVVAAAVSGGGVALGRSPLIDDEISSGRLVRLFEPAQLAGSWNFYVRRMAWAERDPEVDALLGYLLSEA